MSKFQQNLEIFGLILGTILATVVSILLMLATLVLFCAIVAYPVMWAWNYTLPVITKGALSTLNVYQAFVLFLLCRILVGSYSHGQQKKCS
jgi:hypothetical protein